MKRAGGCIPCNADLILLGLSGLVYQMTTHPDAFAHIEKERRTRNQQRIIARAELLSQINGGVLPHRQWLEKNRYWDIVLLKRRLPALFAHLTMANHDNRLKPAGTKWLPVAQKLAKQNCGNLPSMKWLRKRGFNPLCNAKKKHRAMFRSIKCSGKDHWCGPRRFEPQSAQQWLVRFGFSSNMLAGSPTITFRRIPSNHRLAQARPRRRGHK